MSSYFSSQSFLVGAIGFSLLLHVGIWVSVMNVDISQKTSRKEFETWVKDITLPKRKAVLLPAPEEISPPTGTETQTGPNTGIGRTSGKTAGKGGSGSSTRPARRQALGSAGVLGVIGVASSGPSKGGSNNGLADVFSEGKHSVSEEVGSVMTGKKSAALASASQLSRHSGGSAKSPIESGGVVSGQVGTSSRQASEVPTPHVRASANKVIAGNAKVVESALAVIARKNSGFTRCYEHALKNNPDLTGKLSYEITVGQDGEVLEVRFVEDTLRSSDVLDCIKGILLRLRFSPPEGGSAIFGSVLVFGTN